MVNDGDNDGEGAGGSGGATDLLGGGAGSEQGADGQAGGDQGAGGDGQQQPEDGGADPDWYANVSADVGEGEKASLRDWIKAKGFKDLNSLAKSLRSAEQAIHDSGRVKVPGENATAEEIAAWRAAVGAPETPEGYEFTPPVGEDGEPLQLNDGMLKRIAATAHKLGLPKGAMETLVSDFIQGELDDLNGRQREMDTQAQAWVKAQGAEVNAKIALIDKAATALGLTQADMQGLRMAWGPEKALTVMAKLGAGMAEDTLIGGGTGKFGITGAQAQAEIDTLAKDSEFMAKVYDNPQGPEAARWKRLNDAAGEAANRAAQAA